jgi:hypothetical protein
MAAAHASVAIDILVPGAGLGWITALLKVSWKAILEGCVCVFVCM